MYRNSLHCMSVLTMEIDLILKTFVVLMTDRCNHYMPGLSFFVINNGKNWPKI